MVIKLRSIINKIIGISVCVLLSFSIYKKYGYESQTPQSVFVQTDSLLADQTSCALTSFIQTSTQHLASAQFSQDLFSQFPSITAYELEKNASGVLACSVEAATPVLSINHSWVLTDNGRLAPATDFSSGVTQPLRNITMPQFCVTDAFCSCVKNLSPQLFQAYTIVWLNDEEAMLYDQAQPNFAIRFNALTLPQDSVLEQCAVIKSDLEARGVFGSGKKKPQRWIADIRFKNQIVISANAGDERYG